MANFTVSKDKNFLLLQDTSKTNPYRFDINTGIFYGLSGRPLQKSPSGFPTWLRQNYYTTGTLFLMYCIKEEPRNYGIDSGSALSVLADFANLFQIADKLDSIGYRSHNYSCSEYTLDNLLFINDNFKDFAKYVRENGDDASLYNYRQQNEKKIWMKRYNVTPDEHISETTINNLYEYRNQYNNNRLPLILSYFRKGVLDWFASQDRRFDGFWEAIQKIDLYFRMCNALEKEPEKGDFFRNYINTYREYKLAKERIDACAIQKHLAKHPELNFENEKFKIVIPQSRDDFKHEADAMHNCVYSMYMSRVIDGRTNVVFVRKKSDINSPYITCEVNNWGGIVQYLASCNNRVCDADALEFKRLYKAHLENNWQ